MVSELAPLLEPLCHVTFAAAQIALDVRSELEVELKPDGTIVTSADRAVETFLREELVALIPGSTVWGEEFGHAIDEGNGVWLVDPIDGTSNYAYGSPLWGISIALVVEGRIELGVIMLPDLNEIYLAARGHGAYLNGEPIAPIPPGPIRHEHLVSYCPSVLRQLKQSEIPGKMRCAGAFVIDGAFTAMQRYRGLIGMREKLYDVAAAVLIGRELGAEIRYFDGEAWDEADLLDNEPIGRPWVIFPRPN